jgi:hypothetical protein
VLAEERAFKARADSWSHPGPAAAGRDRGLQNALLKLAAILLLLALATGRANEFLMAGQRRPHPQNPVVFPGFRGRADPAGPASSDRPAGRRAARWLLTGYLLLTLAYPGVKFVREILIGQGSHSR